MSSAGCELGAPIDLAFVIDDKDESADSMRQIYSFIRDVLDNVDFENDDDVRIHFVRDCVSVPEIPLHSGTAKDDVLAHLARSRPVSAQTPKLLAAATEKLADARAADMVAFEDAFNFNNVQPLEDVAREEARKQMTVYITNGESGDIEATLREAQRAHEDGISMIGVAIGDDVNMIEMKALVSCEPGDHLHFADSYYDLESLKMNVAATICRGEKTGSS